MNLLLLKREKKMVYIEVYNMKAKKSDKYKFNKEDLTKIGKGAVIAMSSALLVYAGDTLTRLDFGSNTALVVGVLGIVINAGRKWMAGKK